MKITDMLISAIIKKGVLYEARNVDIDFEIPIEKGLLNTDLKPGGVISIDKNATFIPLPAKNIKIKLKAEHMSLKIEKD